MMIVIVIYLFGVKSVPYLEFLPVFDGPAVSYLVQDNTLPRRTSEPLQHLLSVPIS